MSNIIQSSGKSVARMKAKKAYAFHKPWETYAFLTPWILGFLIFTVGPVILSFYYSFTRYDMFTSPEWIGLQNYRDMLNDRRLMDSIRVTFRFVFLTLPFQLSFALLLAVIFKKQNFGVRYYRAIYYLPSLLGGSVGVAILWRNIFNREGLFNQFLAIFGIEGRSWIASPDTVLYTLVALAVWQFGGTMVIFLGGLKQISPELYESAEIDGAGKIQAFFKITIPLLTPIIFFNTVMGIIGGFQAFTSAFIMSDGTGGPLNATLFYSLYLFIRAFRHFAMGYAAAMAWLLLVIIAVFTALLFASAKLWVYYDE